MFLPVSIKEALQEAVFILSGQIPDQARFEAEIILAFVLQKDRIYLYLHSKEELPQEKWETFQSLVKRRAEGEPFAYLTGEKEFLGFTFSVRPGVLIPRPETEHLVEAVVAWVMERYQRPDETAPLGRGLHILDLGTGCGNIAISLLLILPGAFVTAVDLNEEAVELARSNAAALGVDNRLELRCGRFWQSIKDDEKFHVIVSNPPYIPTPALSTLPAEVLYEPRLALDGGEDGLDAYREIFAGAPLHLAAPGLLALETGQGQTSDIIRLAGDYPGAYKRAEIRQDYAGIDRVILFEHNYKT